MTNVIIKIREVYLPFIIVLIGTICMYGLFRWFFDIKLGLIPLKKDLLNFWIPFTLPWIPILMALRKRIRILDIRSRRDNVYFGYQCIMVIAIAIPTIISQNYIEKASFNITSIYNVSEVNNLSNEKYFNINTFRVNKSESLPYFTSRISGRNNENLNFYLYLACPFENTNNVWYGVKYAKIVSNLLSDHEKNIEYRNFLETAQREFDIYNFQNVLYFEKLGYSHDKDGFKEAIQEKHPYLDTSEKIILIPKSNNFKNRLENTIPYFLASFIIGCFVLFIMVIIPKINEKELENFKKGVPLKEDDLKDILEFLNPRGPKKATAILLLINLIVFIIMVLSGLNIVSSTPKELLQIGAHRRFEVFHGEYWRLFTSIFIHGGVMHLFMNLFGLGVSASLLEGIIGKTKLITSFIICGILASITSIYWHKSTISLGASGAIFGLYGLILAFTVFKIYPKHMRRITWVLLALYIGVNLLFGFLGGIDHAAHFGGLISGFILGVIWILIEKKKNNKKQRLMPNKKGYKK